MGWKRFWRHGRRDEELSTELESYVQEEAAARMADGMTADEARVAAMRKLGNTTRMREQVYEWSSLGWIESLAKDLRYAARLLFHSPGFSLAAVLSLALGIGANTAMFQLLDAVGLRSLPIARPDELVEVIVDGGNRGYGVTDTLNANMTNPLWEALHANQQVFSGLFAWGNANLLVGRRPDFRFARGMWVSGDLFPVLGLTPYRGRFLGPDDDRRGCAPGSVVISHAYWQREFGGKDSVVGAPLVIGEQTFQVAGVTPPEFFGLEVGQRFDIALPICTARLWTKSLDERHHWWLIAMGRLKDGWTLTSAAEHVRAQSAALFEQTAPSGYGDNSRWKELRLTVVPAGRGISSWREQYSTTLWLLLGITGLVLLIACANLANLMLARAAAREHEFALRLAIGASRGRLLIQSLAESVLLATTGAVCGIALASLFSQTIVSFRTTSDNGLHLDLGLDVRVLAFTCGVATLTCLVCGLAPAARSAHAEPATVLKTGSQRLTGTANGFTFQRLLVVSQIAISMVLLVGALLFVRSFRNLITFDAGFRQEGVLVTYCDLSRRNLSGEQLAVAKEALLDRIRALPQVEGAATSTKVPLTSSSWTMVISVEGEAFQPAHWSKLTWVSPDYFRVMGIPILAGRDIARVDRAGDRHVMLVNQTFVRRYLAGKQAIGTLVRTGEEPGYPETQYEIVGVVGDTKYSDLREDIPPTAYASMAQFAPPQPWMGLLIRTSGQPDAVISSLQRVFVEENAMTGGVSVLREQVRENLTRERLMSWLSGVFGLLAGMLAATGLYGVMSYSVARRSKEIAIRVALGAGRHDVLSLVLGQAGSMLVVGLTVGTLIALAAGRTARTLLFGLEPHDPVTISVAAGALALVAMLAAYLPALRAARMSPLDGLRAE